MNPGKKQTTTTTAKTAVVVGAVLPVTLGLRRQRQALSSGVVDSPLSLLSECQASERSFLKTQSRQCLKGSFGLQTHVHICTPISTQAQVHTRAHTQFGQVWFQVASLEQRDLEFKMYSKILTRGKGRQARREERGERGGKDGRGERRRKKM